MVSKLEKIVKNSTNFGFARKLSYSQVSGTSIKLAFPNKLIKITTLTKVMFPNIVIKTPKS